MKDTKLNFAISKAEIDQIINFALQEDIGDGDVTSNSIVPLQLHSTAKMVAKKGGVVAGLDIAERVFALVDPSIEFTPLAADGDVVDRMAVIATISGPGRSILQAERVALNFLQRMSGIATLTRTFVDKIGHTSAKILDTRKTVPGLRHFDKLAVALGGGTNHRFGLFDMALIKENHIRAAGSIPAAVQRVRDYDTQNRPIEVEVTDLDEFRQALASNLDRIMLDNMSCEEMRQAVSIRDAAAAQLQRVRLEASGNVNLKTVGQIAATGVDFISVGALTHSVTALDISLLFDLNS